jgi:hypothetical protein
MPNPLGLSWESGKRRNASARGAIGAILVSDVRQPSKTKDPSVQRLPHYRSKPDIFPKIAPQKNPQGDILVCDIGRPSEPQDPSVQYLCRLPSCRSSQVSSRKSKNKVPCRPARLCFIPFQVHCLTLLLVMLFLHTIQEDRHAR